VKVGEGMPRAVPARSFSLRWGVGAVLAAGLISGCSGSAEPAPSGSPGGASPSVVHSGSPSASPSGSVSGSPSVSPSPSSSAPSAPVSIPAAARAHTEAGGIEFAKFVVLEASKAFNTNDTSGLSAVVEPGCRGCDAILTTVTKQKAAGVHVDRVRADVQGAQMSSPFASQGFDVDVLGTEDAATLVDASGRKVDDLPAKELWMRIAVMWAGDAWRVKEMILVQP
jgi:hypothetical protein